MIVSKENKKVEKDKNLDKRESDLDLNHIERKIKNAKTRLKAIEEIRKRRPSMHLNLLDSYCIICIFYLYHGSFIIAKTIVSTKSE